MADPIACHLDQEGSSSIVVMTNIRFVAFCRVPGPLFCWAGRLFSLFAW